MSKSNSAKKPKKGLTIKQRRTLEGLMFVTPWIVGALLFFLYPLVVSIRLSFSKTSLSGLEMTWVGLENYKTLLSGSTTFYKNFVTTIKDTLINTPITLVFSLIIAMMVNRDIKGRGFFRTVFFIPVLLGTGYIMQQLLGLGVGEVVSSQLDGNFTQTLMSALGGTFASIVSDVLQRITVILWKSGVQIILFLAGLQGISVSLYEASRCDGATEWENFWKITLPMISPIILLNFIYTMIDSFTDSSNAIISDILHCFETGQGFAQGSAMGWLYFAFTFLVCGLALGIMRKLTFNSGER